MKVDETTQTGTNIHFWDLKNLSTLFAFSILPVSLWLTNLKETNKNIRCFLPLLLWGVLATLAASIKKQTRPLFTEGTELKTPFRQNTCYDNVNCIGSSQDIWFQMEEHGSYMDASADSVLAVEGWLSCPKEHDLWVCCSVHLHTNLMCPSYHQAHFQFPSKILLSVPKLYFQTIQEERAFYSVPKHSGCNFLIKFFTYRNQESCLFSTKKSWKFPTSVIKI